MGKGKGFSTGHTATAKPGRSYDPSGSHFGDRAGGAPARKGGGIGHAEGHTAAPKLKTHPPKSYEDSKNPHAQHGIEGAPKSARVGAPAAKSGGHAQYEHAGNVRPGGALDIVATGMADKMSRDMAARLKKRNGF